MKPRTLFTISLLSVSAILFDCTEPVETLLPVNNFAIYEPNNTASEATPLAIDDTVRAYIHAEGDKDFYTVTLPATYVSGGVLTVVLDPFPGKAEIKFYDADRAQIGFEYHYAATSGAALGGWLSVLPGKTCYLEVKDFSGNFSTQPYILTMHVTPVPDIFEPNDVQATATPIKLDTAYSAYMFCGQTEKAAEIVDFFKVILPDSGKLEVSVTNVPTNLDVEWMVLDVDGAIVWEYNYVSTKGANCTKVSTKTFTAGSYYVKVQPHTGISRVVTGTTAALPDNAIHPYSISVSLK